MSNFTRFDMVQYKNGGATRTAILAVDQRAFPTTNNTSANVSYQPVNLYECGPKRVYQDIQGGCKDYAGLKTAANVPSLRNVNNIVFNDFSPLPECQRRATIDFQEASRNYYLFRQEARNIALNARKDTAVHIDEPRFRFLTSATQEAYTPKKGKFRALTFSTQGQGPGTPTRNQYSKRRSRKGAILRYRAGFKVSTTSNTSIQFKERQV